LAESERKVFTPTKTSIQPFPRLYSYPSIVFIKYPPLQVKNGWGSGRTDSQKPVGWLLLECKRILWPGLVEEGWLGGLLNEGGRGF
jgi:hypothetical protein